MKKIFVVGAYPESLINFRGDLIAALMECGYKVYALADNEDKEIINVTNTLGDKFISYPVQRNGMNPISDLKTLFTLLGIYKNNIPDIVLAYTIKPIIWSGLALFMLRKVRFYPLITGLGYAFQPGGIFRKILTFITTLLYKVSLLRAEKVIFQNPDNMQEFIKRNIVSKNKSCVVLGSGVNTNYFVFSPIPSGDIKFLLIARLLGDKGIREYYQSALIVKKIYPNVNFRLIGPEDPSSDGIPLEEILAWNSSGIIEYLGAKDDVRSYIADSHVFVLPSYHEGLPRTVLEAMSMGRPILTTDVSGCRETVVEGKNGFLVPKKNIESLVRKMIWFVENQNRLPDMGIQSRKIVEQTFDVDIVNSQLMKIMRLG